MSISPTTLYVLVPCCLNSNSTWGEKQRKGAEKSLTALFDCSFPSLISVTPHSFLSLDSSWAPCHSLSLHSSSFPPLQGSPGTFLCISVLPVSSSSGIHNGALCPLPTLALCIPSPLCTPVFPLNVWEMPLAPLFSQTPGYW